MSDRVIDEGRMSWDVPCGHGRWWKPHGCGCSRWMDEPHAPDCIGDCDGGTRHVVDPRRYRTDPTVKRIIDRVNTLTLENSE